MLLKKRSSIGVHETKATKKIVLIAIFAFLVTVSSYFIVQIVLENLQTRTFDFAILNSQPSGWFSNSSGASVLYTTSGWTVTKTGDKPLGVLQYLNLEGEEYGVVSVFCKPLQSNGNYYVYPSGYKSENETVLVITISMGSLSGALVSNNSILTQTIAQGIPNINQIDGISVQYLSTPDVARIQLLYENRTRISRILSFPGFAMTQHFSFTFQAYLPDDDNSQFMIRRVEFSNAAIDNFFELREPTISEGTPILLFEDDFGGDVIDNEKWRIDQQLNLASVAVDRGSLQIKTTGGVNSSVLLISRNNEIQPPINVTFRARIESFDEANCYAGWIYSEQTQQEADVLETWNNETQYFSAHAQGNEWINSYQAKPVDLSSWHEYTMILTQGGCECYFDGVLKMQCFGLTANDFDVRISIFCLGIAPKGSVFEIDYVRIYSYPNLNWDFSNEI